MKVKAPAKRIFRRRVSKQSLDSYPKPKWVYIRKKTTFLQLTEQIIHHIFALIIYSEPHTSASSEHDIKLMHDMGEFQLDVLCWGRLELE